MKNKILNSFTKYLRADSEDSTQPRQTPGAHYARVQTHIPRQPKLLCWNQDLAEELGIDQLWQDHQHEKYLSGYQAIQGQDSFAMCYGGHQFGNWAGQLGDGRAINLLEIADSNQVAKTIQLKGSGPTAYSRRGDGFAVLRSSLREYVCSEAMYHLGVPTTRALSLSLTGDAVLRDMFYDGHPEEEPGAICSRISQGFIRFGHFEIFAARGEHTELRQLLNYTILHHHRDLLKDTGWGRWTSLADNELWGDAVDSALGLEIQEYLDSALEPEVYLEWFGRLMKQTADLVVHWLRVGFVHGVMNTDNLSVLGETIDYGPYGWLEPYDPQWTPNTTDAQGRRYAFGEQPEIARWNLLQLANAIYPLIEAAEPLQDILSEYSKYFNQQWLKMMSSKLGFEESVDQELIVNLLQGLSAQEMDYILFFRELSTWDCHAVDELDQETLAEVFKQSLYFDHDIEKFYKWFQPWFQGYQKALLERSINQASRSQLMDSVNPLYVPRNYLAQLAIDGVEAGEPEFLENWLQVLRNPYQHQEGADQYAARRPEWARVKAGCSMLSCSS